MMEVPMRGVNFASVAAVITLSLLGGCVTALSERSVTAYEGARLIVGDGRVIENDDLHRRHPANPLDDITHTRRISAVILRGAAVDRTQPVR
jgi:hypothetical protein